MDRGGIGMGLHGGQRTIGLTIESVLNPDHINLKFAFVLVFITFYYPCQWPDDMKFNGPHTLVVSACGGSLAMADLSYSDVGLTHVNAMVKKMDSKIHAIDTSIYSPLVLYKTWNSR